MFLYFLASPQAKTCFHLERAAEIQEMLRYFLFLRATCYILHATQPLPDTDHDLYKHLDLLLTHDALLLFFPDR